MTCIPAYVQAQRDASTLSVIVDISISGVRLATNARLEPSEAVKLTLHFSDDSRKTWTVSGKVVRVEDRAPAKAEVWGRDVGVEFDEPMTDHRDDIAEVNERLAALGELEKP